MLCDSGFDVEKSGKFLFSFLIGNRFMMACDRFMAHLVVPILRNSMVCSLIKLAFGETVLFRIHKNIYDHFYVLARKEKKV
jgi:hypothetical protein